MGKVGGFVGVFLFLYLMHWKRLMAAECVAASVSLIGLFVTWALLPETEVEAEGDRSRSSGLTPVLTREDTLVPSARLGR